MTDERPLLTAVEVARRLKVHPGTVQRWVRDGLLEAVHLPSEQRQRVRFRPEDIEALVEKRGVAS